MECPGASRRVCNILNWSMREGSYVCHLRRLIDSCMGDAILPPGSISPYWTKSEPAVPEGCRVVTAAVLARHGSISGVRPLR